MALMSLPPSIHNRLLDSSQMNIIFELLRKDNSKAVLAGSGHPIPFKVMDEHDENESENMKDIEGEMS